MIVHGKVAIAIRIGAGRRDVRWVENIGVHEVELEEVIKFILRNLERWRNSLHLS